MYVGDSTTNAATQWIYTFAATANGATAPSSTLFGTSTSLFGTGFIFFDSLNNRLWSSQTLSTNVTAYSTSSLNGNNTPTFNLTGFGTPGGVYVDGSGKIYVVDTANSRLEIFPAGSNNNASPTSVITSGLAVPQGVWLDSSGRIYVANENTSTISIYAANAASGASPVATISGSGLSGPLGITLDSANDVWVTNEFSGTVSEFAPIAAGASGTLSPGPMATISYSGFGGPWDIVVDPAGYVYVGNNSSGQVDVFAPGLTGTVIVATQVLTTSANGGFACPMGIAVH